jgi:hypothetical protein
MLCFSNLMFEAARRGPRFKHQPEAQHPKSPAIHKPAADYPIYYNESRVHRSLNKDAPFHRAIERLGAITSHAILGGLHHQYCRI